MMPNPPPPFARRDTAAALGALCLLLAAITAWAWVSL